MACRITTPAGGVGKCPFSPQAVLAWIANLPHFTRATSGAIAVHLMRHRAGLGALALRDDYGLCCTSRRSHLSSRAKALLDSRVLAQTHVSSWLSAPSVQLGARSICGTCGVSARSARNACGSCSRRLQIVRAFIAAWRSQHQQHTRHRCPQCSECSRLLLFFCYTADLFSAPKI